MWGRELESKYILYCPGKPNSNVSLYSISILTVFRVGVFRHFPNLENATLRGLGTDPRTPKKVSPQKHNGICTIRYISLVTIKSLHSCLVCYMRKESLNIGPD